MSRAHYLDEVANRITGYLTDEHGNHVSVDKDGFTYADIIEQVAEEKSRLDGIGNVYQTADRIITSDSDITVSVVSDKEMDTTATNNGRDIIFNSSLIEDLDTDTIVSMNGTNYHELAHILFSPRAGSSLGQYVTNNKMRRSFNMLEEARIEKMLVAKYPSTRMFLEATVLGYALKDSPDNWGDMFPVLTGRRYLDLELRQMIADKFIQSYGVDMANKVSSIVNEYGSLVFPTDFTRGMELIAEYSELVGLDTEPQGQSATPNGGGDGHNHNERPVLQKGRPASTREQERLQGKESGKSESLDGEETANGNEGNGTKPARGVGGDGGQYQGEEKSYTNSDESIAQALTERLKAITSDGIVKEKVREVRKAITGNDEVRSTLKQSKHYDQEVSVTASNFARRFGSELERMVRDSDPHWERFLPSGKLNVTRTMTPDVNAIGQMFDVWDTGNDNTDIEAVILLDNSGSMGGLMTEVCEKAWIIKRGIEAIDGNVTVYNFHSDSEMLYSKKDKAKPRQFRNVYATGSTNPLTALVEAERTLTTTDKHIKMLFVVTDGEWERTEECDTIIKRLNAKNIITCVVYMGDYENIYNLVNESKQGNDYAKQYLTRLRHSAGIFKAVASPKDVLELAVDIVKSKVGKS